MKASKKPIAPPANESRTPLERSEKKAFEHEPNEFRDEATGQKIVEVGPVLSRDPIKGIDPAK